MNIPKDWLVGFIEGEGNFHVSLVKNFKSKKWKYSFEYYPILQFRIFLREDDRAVLEKIKETLGVGKIYKKSYDYSRKKGINSQDQYAYYISSVKELNVLRKFLSQSEFYTKKKKDMLIFFKILDIKNTKNHFTVEGYREILALAQTLNSGNRDKFKVKPLTE